MLSGRSRSETTLSPSRTPSAEKKPDIHAKRADEAMRRATEEATKGPREARAGRFDWKPKPKAAE
jgi:hypothetical protein